MTLGAALIGPLHRPWGILYLCYVWWVLQAPTFCVPLRFTALRISVPFFRGPVESFRLSQPPSIDKTPKHDASYGTVDKKTGGHWPLGVARTGPPSWPLLTQLQQDF